MTESILNILQTAQKPLLCLEVNPPRGSDFTAIFKRLEGRVGSLDFLNVTDSALAKMRMNPLVFASILKQQFKIEPMVNISCRDRNVIALQADLLAGWVLGIKSVIALTGDAVSIGDMPETKGVFEVNSVGLLDIVRTLNNGKDLAGNELHGAPSYCAGVVVNPNVKNIGPELRRLAKKKDAGAKYALSQPVFDEERSLAFFKEAHTIGIDLFIGLLPFKNAKAALGISKIPGIKVPEQFLEVAERDPEADLSARTIEHCLNIAKLNRSYVKGFHVISGATPKLALELVDKLSDYIKTL